MDGKDVLIDLQRRVYYFKLSAYQGNSNGQVCLQDDKSVSKRQLRQSASQTYTRST
jgi:hypothetical protein